MESIKFISKRKKFVEERWYVHVRVYPMANNYTERNEYVCIYEYEYLPIY